MCKLIDPVVTAIYYPENGVIFLRNERLGSHKIDVQGGKKAKVVIFWIVGRKRLRNPNVYGCSKNLDSLARSAAL